MHTHLGVDSSPELNGAEDYNSEKGLILPHLRALDGLNTHDDAYKGTASGGITTALVLPGSGNGIGEQPSV
jgi:imidazolonepropionase-like amidohydrolase